MQFCDIARASVEEGRIRIFEPNQNRRSMPTPKIGSFMRRKMTMQQAPTQIHPRHRCWVEEECRCTGSNSKTDVTASVLSRRCTRGCRKLCQYIQSNICENSADGFSRVSVRDKLEHPKTQDFDWATLFALTFVSDLRWSRAV